MTPSCTVSEIKRDIGRKIVGFILFSSPPVFESEELKTECRALDFITSYRCMLSGPHDLPALCSGGR